MVAALPGAAAEAEAALPEAAAEAARPEGAEAVVPLEAVAVPWAGAEARLWAEAVAAGAFRVPSFPVPFSFLLPFAPAHFE